MGVNKIIYGKETLIDLTGLTVTPEKLVKGATAINKAGEIITGTASIATLTFETGTKSIPVGSLQIVVNEPNTLYFQTDTKNIPIGSLELNV